MLRTFIRDYPYIHLGLGLIGNTLFVIGSILFFKIFADWYTVAVWCFVIGSALMLVGAAGKALTDLEQAHLARQRRAARAASRVGP